MDNRKFKKQINKATGETRYIPILEDENDIPENMDSSQHKFRGAENRQVQKNEPGRFMSGVTGFNTAFKRLAEGILQPAFEGGLLGEKAKSAFGETVKKREREYEEALNANPASTIAGDIIGNISVGLPFMGGGAALAARGAQTVKNVPALGKVAASPYAQGIAGGALGGAAMGGAEYVNPGQTRLGNAGQGAAIGAGFGAAAPVIGAGVNLGVNILKPAIQGSKDAYQWARRALGSEPHIIEDLMKRYSPQEISLALKNQQAAKELGIDLTPAEAGQNMIGAKYEGKLGTSPEGDRRLYDFKKNQKDQEQEAIRNLLHKVEPTGENASEAVRNASKKVIEKKEKALEAKARPHYDIAEHKLLSPNTLNSLTKDGNINKAYKEVLEDPVFQSEIAGFKPNSIKVLDEVKKRLDGQIGTAKRAGDKNLARILRNSKNRLVEKLDEISPEYKKARAIYSEESPLIDLVRNREVGKIAKLNDVNIKKVASIIFDPSQTDPKVMNRLRDEISKENPEAWAKIVRNAMQKKVSSGKSEHPGTNFYNQVLKNDNTYDQFHSALKGNKEAQEKLKIMKSIFKDVINPRTPKGAEALAKSSLDVPRSGPEAVKKAVANANKGKFDNAAIGIITSDKWKKAFFDKMMDLPKPEKERLFAKTFEKASKEFGKKATKGSTAATIGLTTERPFLETENYEIYK